MPVHQEITIEITLLLPLKMEVIQPRIQQIPIALVRD